jgi:hypothetical protein
MFTRDSSYEKTWKESPGHPNSMQKPLTQEHDAGETARKPSNYETSPIIA